ncbi:MAG: DUF1926 domain-containing protein [bacterium]|nr:MAG: DUF1926 domain-containing protein [bacterium]
MDKKVTFILGLHNHQPVGNFNHVIEEAFQNAYLPFLEVLNDYPDIPFALHNSGVLWDWYETEHPEYIELLMRMISRGQVEIMSGGYYEPILSVIPERDRQGQLAMMKDYILGRFGTVPRGCWLTERIWEPHLPKTLSDAGLSYVIVDDSHFKSTGFLSSEMRGFFMTEEDGAYTHVFPIDKKLRYLIPFSEPENAIRHFREVAREGSNDHRIAVLADDGEKFGLWPGTHELCYGRSWLRRFCEALLDNREWIEISTFSRVLDACQPIGIVYLPTASYSEMMEWALPLRAQERYKKVEHLLAGNDAFQEPADVIRGGFWRNFLVKYEESNWMHKRMLFVSDIVERYRQSAGADTRFEQARHHLYQAQCNCAYWHGLFGGLYLPHLRSAVYTHLIEAERVIDEAAGGTECVPEGRRGDIDGDGVEEVILASRYLQAFFKTRGATLRELDAFSPPFNLTDTLTRREELYHRTISEVGEQSPGRTEEATSIHNISHVKERDLERYLSYDFHLRSSLRDHFIETDVDLDSFASAQYREAGDFLDNEYLFDVQRTGDGATIVFERKGTISLEKGNASVLLTKRVSLSGSAPELEVAYTVKNLGGKMECCFAVESIFNLLAGNAPDRYFRFPDRKIRDTYLQSTGEEADVGSISIVDKWLNVEITLTFNPTSLLWRFPIETISNSESGFERIYQGSSIVPVWHIDLKRGGRAECGIRVSVRPVHVSRRGVVSR